MGVQFVIDTVGVQSEPESYLADIVKAFWQRSRWQVYSDRIEAGKRMEQRPLRVAFNATGDFLTWTSDDNLYKKNAIETMLNYLIEHPECDFVYTDYDQIDADGKQIGTIIISPPEMLVEKNVVGACFLFRRKVYEQVGEYCQDVYLAEDYDYWLRVSQKFTMHSLHVNLYFYRRHKNTLTDTRGQAIIRAARRARRRHRKAIYPFWRRLLPNFEGSDLFQEKIVPLMKFLHIAGMRSKIKKGFGKK